jgi:hypothetical protein
MRWAAYLDDFVAGKFEFRDVGSVAGHEIAVQDSQDRFVGYDEQIIVFTLQLENDGFQSHSEIMV